MTSFDTRKDARAAGWFSRRHQTRDAHAAAREHYRTRADRRPAQWWDAETGEWVHAEDGAA